MILRWMGMVFLSRLRLDVNRAFEVNRAVDGGWRLKCKKDRRIILLHDDVQC